MTAPLVPEPAGRLFDLRPRWTRPTMRPSISIGSDT